MVSEHLWRVENACWAAWPSAEDTIIDGWLCRAAGGETRRTNSVNATPTAGAVQDVVEPASAFYRERSLPLLVRALSTMPEVGQALAAMGFQPEGETCTLQAKIGHTHSRRYNDLESRSNPSPAWIADKLRLSPMNAQQEAAYRTMLARLSLPTRFVRLCDAGKGVSLAYGALVDGLLVIESVVTDPDHRGKGLAGEVVGALMDWAREQGASLSCLQVEASNAPAIRTYRKLGYETELYRYQYWRAPKSEIKT